MTSEELKATDRVEGAAPSTGTPPVKSTDPASQSAANRPVEGSPPNMDSKPEARDRWDDAEIDAAVDVLERPSQPPKSVSMVSEASGGNEVANVPLERPSASLSVSAIEKSKRGGSDRPGADEPVAAISNDVAKDNESDGPVGQDVVPSSSRSIGIQGGGEQPLETDTNSFNASESSKRGVDDAMAAANQHGSALERPMASGDPKEEAQLGRPMVLLPSDTAGGAREDSRSIAEAGAGSSGNPGAESAEQDVTRHYDASALKSGKSGDRVPASPTRPGSGQRVAGTSKPTTSASSNDSEEPTAYWDRRRLAGAEQPTSTQAVEVEQPTLFYHRDELAGPTTTTGRLGAADAEEPTICLPHGRSVTTATQSSTSTRSERAAGTASGSAPKSPAQPVRRPSSIAPVASHSLLSAETADPPLVTSSRASRSADPLGGLKPAGVPQEAPANPLRLQSLTQRGSTPSALGDVATSETASSSASPIQSKAFPPATQHQSSEQAKSAPARAPIGASTGNDQRASSRPASGGERVVDSPLGVDGERPSQGITGVGAFSVAAIPGSAGYEEEVWLDPLPTRIGRRLLRVAASCAVAGLILAPVDAWYAQRAAAEHPSFWQLTLACAGVTAPLMLVVAIVLTALSILLHPDSAPSVQGLRTRLRPGDIRRRARLAVILGVSPLVGSCWIVLVASAALPLLGTSTSPSAIGALLSAAAAGLALVLAAPVLAVARYVGVRIRASTPDPIRWGLFGTLVGAMPLVLAIGRGPTSGAGTMFDLFGVFKRPELDLRAPCLLFAVATIGYLLPKGLSGLRLIWLVLPTLLPLGLTYRAASRGLDSRSIALAVERGAPLSRIALGVERRVTDRDHDGFSSAFGGGDCDDRDKNRNPGADDVPENGIDEDCSGADARAVSRRSITSTPAELLQERRNAIPSNLNLILIIVDTLRADVLRHAKHVTPRLDELAERATSFEHAYAPASYTGRSVGPILIGKHSSETNRDFGHFAAFSKKDTFVQQRLQAAGIRTISVQGYWYFHQSQYGFDRGFSVVDSEASAVAGYVEGDRSSTGRKQADQVLRQLDKSENTAGRFFLWTQFTDPHAEYVAHEGFDFGSDQMGKYLGEVAFVDQQIGRIIDYVRAKPWGARTAIVVTSDHGEAFGEHGMLRHGFELWEPLVRVPLVVYVPGIASQRIRVRRSLIDLAPTILDLMQVAPPGEGESDFLSGRSLLPELLALPGAEQSRPVLVDMAHGPYTAERQAFIDGDMKLVTAQGRPLGLFDLAADPAEKRDLLDNAVLRERAISEYRAHKRNLRIVEVRGK